MRHFLSRMGRAPFSLATAPLAWPLHLAVIMPTTFPYMSDTPPGGGRGPHLPRGSYFLAAASRSFSRLRRAISAFMLASWISPGLAGRTGPRRGLGVGRGRLSGRGAGRRMVVRRSSFAVWVGAVLILGWPFW